jgi:hypothetical protein
MSFRTDLNSVNLTSSLNKKYYPKPKTLDVDKPSYPHPAIKAELIRITPVIFSLPKHIQLDYFPPDRILI